MLSLRTRRVRESVLFHGNILSLLCHKMKLNIAGPWDVVPKQCITRSPSHKNLRPIHTERQWKLKRKCSLMFSACTFLIFPDGTMIFFVFTFSFAQCKQTLALHTFEESISPFTLSVSDNVTLFITFLDIAKKIFASLAIAKSSV